MIHRVAVTGASGQIAYSLLFRIAAGGLFGPDQKVALHLLEIPDTQGVLKGVTMELDDCAFPLLAEVVTGSDPEKVFSGVDTAFLIGSKPRGPGMERKELLKENGQIFEIQGRALDKVAAKEVTVLVVGNPCNTNCWIAIQQLKRLKAQQFFAMTRLDQNRATALIAAKARVAIEDVKGAIIWGNHSSTQVPDLWHATIRGRPAAEVIGDPAWCEGTFISTVQGRGAAVIAARGKSSAASAAHAALGSMKSLLFPTPSGDRFSVALFAENNPYGIDSNLVFSFPCVSQGGGNVSIVPGLSLSDFLRAKITASERELLEERGLVG